jgi:hypothetical protein
VIFFGHRERQKVSLSLIPGVSPSGKEREESMPDTSPEQGLTRTERLQIVMAALRGVLSGAARAIVTWLLDNEIHH